ncbi:hypothetical protein AB0H76_15405 [Nocardia sp. NPDC050712]|uniref:hypothetical protein n=1 Tax=Nocardia sp. NPDC050712 TaxID=3155518 RepID=UPI0033DF13DF
MEPSELVGAVEALTAAVGELSERLDVQQENLDQQQKMLDEIERQRKGLDQQRKGLNTTRIILGVVAVVVVAVAVLYGRVDANSDGVREVQERTSTEILCPLYAVLATSMKVNPPSPNLTAEQAKARQAAADAIIAGLEKLGCT